MGPGVGFGRPASGSVRHWGIVNGFLWLGVISTVVLVAAIVVDAMDDVVDALDFGVDWLSLPVVLAFLGAFGFGAGAFVDGMGALALLPGIGAGLAFAWLAHRLTRAAMGMRTDPTESEASMLGSLGRVLVSPTPDRFGEVLLQRPTGPVKVSATAGVALAPGTEIVVVDVVSSTLVTVEPLDFSPTVNQELT